MKNDKRLTEWSQPSEILNSQYGKVTYREWCDKECARINERGDGVKIVTREDGCIALSR
jgi:hypothetical protein